MDLADGRKALLIEKGPNRIAFIGCNAKGGSFAQANETNPGAAFCDMDWMAGEISRLKQELRGGEDGVAGEATRAILDSGFGSLSSGHEAFSAERSGSGRLENDREKPREGASSLRAPQPATLGARMTDRGA